MKKIPPFTFTFAMMFWAWQSGHWVAAATAAIWIEWALRTPRRWSLANKDIHRIVDLTSLALIALALYQSRSGPFAQAIFAILHWSPLLFLPLLSAQLLSGRAGVERRALYYSKRNSKDPSVKREVDLRFPYVAACLMAASQDAIEPVAYFPGVALIITWILWWNRPRRKKLPAWVLLLGIAVGLGYLGQMGLRQAQTELENAALEWFSEFYSNNTDPYRTTTSLGDIGTLKLSDSILYRVETDKPLFEPLLLRTSAYNRYVDTTWFNLYREFIVEGAAAPGDTWQWDAAATAPAKGGKGSRWARISAYLDGKQSILPLPTATWGIDDLPVTSLSRHPLGALRVGEGPELVRYRARFGRAVSTDAPPEESDLRIPSRERATLAGLAEQLGLADLQADQAMQRVKDYFRQQFRYTLEMPGKKSGQTALSHFLLERRRGHCEYFASATVLVLRQAGIPARYAVGYSTQEASGPPRQYVVRASHAHAWSLVWHDGQWWDLDTTPSTWYRQEAEQAPFWRPLLDLVSDLYYQYAVRQLAPRDGKQNPWLWGLLVLLFLVLGYRLRPGKAFRLNRGSKGYDVKPQLRTPLAAIESVLDQAGFPRSRWETYGTWLKRLQQRPPLAEIGAELEEILRLHYRFRYRDAGISQLELQRMQELVDDWLRRWNKASIERHIANHQKVASE